MRSAGISRRERGRGAGGPWVVDMIMVGGGFDGGTCEADGEADEVVLTGARLATVELAVAGTKRGVLSSEDSESEDIQRLNGKRIELVECKS